MDGTFIKTHIYHNFYASETSKLQKLFFFFCCMLIHMCAWLNPFKLNWQLSLQIIMNMLDDPFIRLNIVLCLSVPVIEKEPNLGKKTCFIGICNSTEQHLKSVVRPWEWWVFNSSQFVYKYCSLCISSISGDQLNHWILANCCKYSFVIGLFQTLHLPVMT